MTGNPTISVIVPVYNVEKYLLRCIDSILNQTFTDFELLLIDDGSKDNSGNICDEYAKKDSRIRVFHKENGGVSSARNMGLDYARGEWICFVDSDDWLDIDYLEGFNYETSSDLLLQGFKKQMGHNILKVEFESEEYANVSILKKIVEFEKKEILIFRPPWAKLFKKKIIEDCCLTFDPSISIGEDFLFVLYYILHIDRICISSKCGYNYRIVDSSLTFKPYSMETRIRISNEFYKIGDLLTKKHCYPQLLEELMKYRVLGCLRNAYRKECVKDDRLAALEFYHKHQYNYGYKWLPMPYRLIKCLCILPDSIQDKILTTIFFSLNKMKKFQISTIKR